MLAKLWLFSSYFSQQALYLQAEKKICGIGNQVNNGVGIVENGNIGINIGTAGMSALTIYLPVVERLFSL